MKSHDLPALGLICNLHLAMSSVTILEGSQMQFNTQKTSPIFFSILCHQPPSPFKALCQLLLKNNLRRQAVLSEGVSGAGYQPTTKCSSWLIIKHLFSNWVVNQWTSQVHWVHWFQNQNHVWHIGSIVSLHLFPTSVMSGLTGCFFSYATHTQPL